MHYRFCPFCGRALSSRLLGDEGEVPYCEDCRMPLFDHAYACVLVLVVNDKEEAALLSQPEVIADYPVLVAGYIRPGDSAEEAALRETAEELGLAARAPRYIRSYYNACRDRLMLGFLVRTGSGSFRLSGEVAGAGWVPLSDAPTRLRPGSTAAALAEDALLLLHPSTR